MTALDSARLRTTFNYHTLRNISSPDDVANDRRVYSGNAPGAAFYFSV